MRFQLNEFVNEKNDSDLSIRENLKRMSEQKELTFFTDLITVTMFVYVCLFILNHF